MNCTKITSVSNPKIKQAFDIKNKRSKYKSAAFIIEGPHLIEMAISSGHQIKEAFFTSTFSAKKDVQKLMGQLPKHTGEIFEVTDHILHKLTGTETPQGIIAIASYNPTTPDDIAFKSIPLIVIIDNVQEPGNLGAIIRTSDAAGADAVIILKGTCDVFSQKTIRATAGSIFNIPVVYAETDKLLEWLKAKKISLAATSLDANKSIFNTDLKKPIAFVFGNEAHGITTHMQKNSDLILKIPIFGKAESLNVSASAAVCLYEAVRQRRIKV
ncbi:MAG: RNA methyltransferase TrmH family [Nitrospirae bacterium]|nr:MAG: RNA methyltransferase TrmH family [Nitrospirota bacterium]